MGKNWIFCQKTANISKTTLPIRVKNSTAFDSIFIKNVVNKKVLFLWNSPLNNIRKSELLKMILHWKLQRNILCSKPLWLNLFSFNHNFRCCSSISNSPYNFFRVLACSSCVRFCSSIEVITHNLLLIWYIVWHKKGMILLLNICSWVP